MILVSRRPEVYRKAVDPRHECGAYQLRAVLNAFDKDAEPGELYYSPAQRQRDWSLPWLMPSILRRYGIRSKWHVWTKFTFKKRIISALESEQPVLLVVNSIRGAGNLHWISVWGYDETTDEFLCYDSQAPASEGTVGNTRYSTSVLTSHLPWFGTFSITIEDKGN